MSFQLHWTDKESQGTLPGEEYATVEDAHEGIPEFLAMLLNDAAADDADREWILDGSISCVRTSDGALFSTDNCRDI